MKKVAKGLAGVVVDSTEISNVQAEGALSYRGHAIETLVDRPFFQVANLVVTGDMNDALHQLLKPSMNLTPAETASVLQIPAQMHPMKVLQGIVPLLSRTAELGFGEADQGLHVAAKLPAVVATHLRRQAVELNPELGYAEAFLRAIGNSASAEHIEAFNTAQILQLDHGFNAGTFAARVVASTLASVESCIAAGIGALSGPLHGGADQAVLEIADSLTSVADARDYVAKALAAGEKVPGMGHREYRAVDPRAVCLQAWVEKLAVGSEHEPVYHLLREIDTQFASAMAQRGKALHANVEFYKGLVLRVVGLPNHFFTAAFAMARSFGYVAHFIESRKDNRIFRPQAEYVGH
ncbi:MAG: citrate/2-methylcitrate synthase [Pseudomonadaceae bacterium]|nr:citrate/2-methylcitrate synthase [Pseudomonadaceae bacterium]